MENFKAIYPTIFNTKKYASLKQAPNTKRDDFIGPSPLVMLQWFKNTNIQQACGDYIEIQPYKHLSKIYIIKGPNLYWVLLAIQREI